MASIQFLVAVSEETIRGVVVLVFLYVCYRLMKEVDAYGLMKEVS